MNQEKLELLFRNYIRNFDFINDPDTHFEKYKWIAVGQVQKCWDLAARDLPGMIKAAFSESYNLINNRIVQPVNGLINAAKRESEKVRKALDNLLEETDDVDEIQEKIQTFVDEINAILEKYYPSSWKYAQDTRSAIMYLAMIEPSRNYMFKSTPAHTFARWMEYEPDIGSGVTFRLKHYYRMCDELVAAIKECPELLMKDADRATEYRDKSYHLLAYDLIYCFGVYKELRADIRESAPKTKSSPGKQSEPERINYAEAIQAELNDLQDKIDFIEKEISEMPEIVLAGASVNTKAYGEVTIDTQNGNYISFTAEGKERSFVLPDCIAKGFIIPKDEALITVCKEMSEKRKEIEKLNQLQRLRNIELKKYL